MASIFRSAAPPHVPPASRRMPGSAELLLLGSTSNSPHSWSNDATTQRPGYPTKGTPSNLIRTPLLRSLGLRASVARRRSIDIPPAWGATVNRQPVLSTLTAEYFAAACPAPTQPPGRSVCRPERIRTSIESSRDCACPPLQILRRSAGYLGRGRGWGGSLPCYH